MDRIGVQATSHFKVSVIFGTMSNFNGDFDGHGNNNVTCKQAFRASPLYATWSSTIQMKTNGINWYTNNNQINFNV